MNKTFRWITALFICLVVIFLVDRCGTPVCIAGFGQCGNSFLPANSVSTGGMLLTAPTSIIAPGATLQFTASGGTPPYTYSLTTGIGSVDPNVGLYTAPTSVTTQTSVTVRAQDSVGDFATDTITIQ
jgi:hypothetical protein